MQCLEVIPHCNSFIPYTSDSTETFSNQYYNDSTPKVIFTKQKGDTFLIKEYWPNSIKMEYQAFLTRGIDSQYVENEVGDLVPMPIYSNWYPLKVGNYAIYDRNGNVKTIGFHNNDLPHGPWLHFSNPNLLTNTTGTLINCTFYKGQFVGDFRGKSLYHDNTNDTSYIYLSSKGKFGIGNHFKSYYSKEPTSVKIGKWIYYDPFGKIIKEENHEFKGKLLDVDLKD